MSNEFTMIKDQLGKEKKINYVSFRYRARWYKKDTRGRYRQSGGDSINFSFCLVNLRRRSIFVHANHSLDFFIETLADACSLKPAT